MIIWDRKGKVEVVSKKVLDISLLKDFGVPITISENYIEVDDSSLSDEDKQKVRDILNATN